MQVTTIDLAKHVFHLHGVAANSVVALRKRLGRSEVLSFFAKLPACRIGMEACGTAHHWARELKALGHDVRLMPPAYLKPCVKRGKNDAADAEAICEAMQRPTMLRIDGNGTAPSTADARPEFANHQSVDQRNSRGGHLPGK